MKKLLLGFIVGIFLAGGAYLFYQPDPAWRLQLGEMLDTDVVYLVDGTLLRGRITYEDAQKILIEVDDGYFTLPRSRYRNIQKNVLLRYLRELV